MRSQSPPDPSVYPSIRALFSAFAAIYYKEDDRIAAFSPHLHTLIGGTFLIVRRKGLKVMELCHSRAASPQLIQH